MEAAGMERWYPKCEATRQEQFILKRLETKRKLFGFLRRHRHEIFDDAFQAELESMYRDTGAGSDPVPPAQLAMALLLQGYLGLSDSDAVEAAVMDLRWQMVLGCLGATEPPFSQGALQTFRERLIAHDMDRRLLERTVELANSTKEFEWKKLPKTLRVAIDSPLEAWRCATGARARRSGSTGSSGTSPPISTPASSCPARSARRTGRRRGRRRASPETSRRWGSRSARSTSTEAT
jgi:hypothetical protein